MPRYYTLCETTAGKQLSKSRGETRYLRIYPHPAEGFLFHDSEKALTFTDIQKALWMLSDLYEGARRVIAVRVDDNTVMATFSTVALPRPVRPALTFPRDTKADEYLESSKLAGWLLQDIKDPAAEPIPVEYNDLYNDCIMLERVTDCCPCIKQAEGTCFPSTVYLRYPWLADNTTNYSGTEPSRFRTKRFEKIDEFEYVSGQFAIKQDFTEAIRPWDNYDFGLVEKRRGEFADRGLDTAHRSAHRKVECSRCVFSVRNHNGSYSDCGHIPDCTTHITEDQAWAVLFDWLQNETYFMTGVEGFTKKEIDYLIKETGRQESSRALSETRKVPTYLAGFNHAYYKPAMTYKVTAARGHLGRYHYYESYDRLRRDYPMLPASADIPDVVIEPKMLLAHAIFAGWTCIRGSSKGWGHRDHPLWRIELMHGTMSAYGQTTNGFFHGPSLRVASAVNEYVHALWPGRQCEITSKYMQLTKR